MNKKVILLVFLLLVPLSAAESFTWKLGNTDEINGGTHTIGFTGSCSFGSKIGRQVGRIGNQIASGIKSVGKVLGLAVLNANLIGASENNFDYSFKESSLYSISFKAGQSHDGCSQELRTVLSGTSNSYERRYSPPMLYGEQTFSLGGERFSKVYFERNGGSTCYSPGLAQRESACNIMVSGIKIIAFDQNHISGRTSVFLGDEAKLLGKSSDLIKNMQGIIFLASNNPKVMVWLGKKDLYDKKSTGDPNAEVFACLDSDENTQCDFVQAKNCNGDWYAGSCCDGKSYDVGFHEIKPGIKAICGKNQNDKWQWAPLNSAGMIADYKNPNMLLAPAKTQSNTYEYLVCSGSFGAFSQNVFGGFLIDKQGSLTLNALGSEEKHNYFCDTNQKVLAECHGNYPAFSQTNSYGTGEKLVAGQRNIYCGKDGIWAFDLDYLGEGACVNAGFGWTGTKCCGEPEDFPEYYNDQGNLPISGGCWESNYVQKGNTVKNNQILNHNGQFYGCQTSSTTPINVAQKNQCEVIEDATNDSPPKQFVCQTNKEWQKVEEKGIRTLTSSGWQVNQGIQEGCCLKDDCWDGNQCQKKGFIHEENGKYYLCG